MTHIIVHQSKIVREKYLLKLVSYILDKEITNKSLSKNPDIHILDKGNKSIGIEDVKKIQKEMVYQPFLEKSQLCIIFDSQNLTHEAQNSLLKTLEEQSTFTHYILLINDEKNLLETIISRGIKHYVKEKGEEKEVSKPTILSHNLIDKFKEIEELSQKENEEIYDLLKKIQLYFRDILKEKINNKEDIGDISRKIEIVQTAYERIQGNCNKKLILENMFIQMKGQINTQPYSIIHRSYI